MTLPRRVVPGTTYQLTRRTLDRRFYLQPSPELNRVYEYALAFARIENHFFTHDSWLEPNQIIRDARRLAGIPAVIVQGRYDLVCPIRSADDLTRAWPEARYTIVPDAGHSAMEPGTRSALVGGMDRFRDQA